MHDIDLLKIHRRRLAVLEKQIAMAGGEAYADAGKLMEAQNTRDSVAEIEKTLGKRLQYRREQSALYGISADPSIGIEIEEIESYFAEFYPGPEDKGEYL